MPDLPKLSPKYQAAVDAYKANGGDKEAAYLVAYPASMSWKPETLTARAKKLFDLKAVKAHVTGKPIPKPKRKAKTKGMRASPKKKRPPPPVPPSKLTKEVRKVIAEYLDDYGKKYKHPYPSVVGLAAVCKVSSNTIYEWNRNPDIEVSLNLRDVLARIEDVQHMEILHCGWDGQKNGPQTINKLLLERKHGYEEIQRIEHTGAGGGAVQTAALVITSGMPVDEATKVYRQMLSE